MAGRKGQKAVIKSGFDQSSMVYVSMTVVLIVLSLTLYTFGIDFGFMHFGGTPNVNILYGGAVICVILSYICDVMYIKTIKNYYRAKASFLDYIPYINFIGVFDKIPAMISWGLVAIAGVILIPSMTPIGQFMPVDYLVLISRNSVFIVLAIMVIYSIIRGYYALKFKRQADGAYKQHISEDYGAGGFMSYVSYTIYFLPIIRSVSLFTDLNFIKTVKSELDEMYRREE